MLNVSQQAVDVLAETLENSDAGDQQGLRLARTPAGEYGLAVDEQREGDQVVRREDRPVLLVDQEVSASLDGATLEVVELPEGRRLTLRDPEQAAN